MTHGTVREEEVNRLVQENRKLVDFAVTRYLKRFRVEGMEREDLISWGLMGLVYAARAWDPGRGLQFSTLAVTAIERMISRGVRTEWRASEAHATLSLDELLTGEDAGDGSRERHLDQVQDDSSTVEDQIVELETRLTLRKAVAELSPEQQWVVQKRFYEDRTLQEIARDVGTTRQAIHLRERAILQALRRKLNPAAVRAA
jgi:RNA polymerase sigma factor (sigma-70 family)